MHSNFFMAQLWHAARSAPTRNSLIGRNSLDLGGVNVFALHERTTPARTTNPTPELRRRPNDDDDTDRPLDVRSRLCRARGHRGTQIP